MRVQGGGYVWRYRILSKKYKIQNENHPTNTVIARLVSAMTARFRFSDFIYRTVLVSRVVSDSCFCKGKSP